MRIERLRPRLLLLFLVLCCFWPHAVNAQCNGQGRTATYQSGLASACICDSGFAGLACATNASVTCSPVDPIANMLDVGASLTSTVINDDDVWFTIQVPMTHTRAFTAMSIGTCPESYFTQLAVISDPALCYDSWVIGISVSNLTAHCGFAYSDDIVTGGNPGTETYNGSLYVNFTETILIGGLVDTVRAYTIDLPVRLQLQDQYTAGVNIFGVQVFGHQQFDAAITGQRITTASSTSSSTLTYIVPYPYQARYFNPILSQVVIEGSSLVPATLVDDNDDTISSDPNNAANCTGTGAYSGDYTNAGGTCMKSLKVLFTHGSECRLNGTYNITDIYIGCGIDVATADCPLGTALSAAYLTFSVRSENFCSSSATNNVINNAITVDQFIAPNRDFLLYNATNTHNNLSQSTWRWGDLMFMRMHFLGLPVYEVNCTDIKSNWGAGFGTINIDMQNLQSGAIPAGYGGAQKPAALGLDFDNQAFLMMAMIDTTFVSSDVTDDYTALQYGPQRGVAYSLMVQVTIRVSYTDTNGQFRRRRRQVQQSSSLSSGQASLGLSPQKIVAYETTAAEESAASSIHQLGSAHSYCVVATIFAILCTLVI